MDQILTKEQIFLNQPLYSQAEVFRFIAQKAVELGLGDDEQAIYQSLQEREQQASTGLQDGIAIPHTLSQAIKQSAILFIRTQSPLAEWQTIDDQPVQQIIVMLAPQDGAQEHLQLLANLATSLIDAPKRQELVASQSVQDVYQILTNN